MSTVERPSERAEEALLKAGALQRAIFNSANFSSIATDAKGVIQIFNVGAERMLGYTAAEVTNTITPADISDPQEVIARAKALSAELGTPITPGFEALVFKASRGIEDIYELTYIRKDGSRFPAVVSVTALRDAQDAIIGYLLIGTDNTARQAAADELHRLQSAALNAAADAIVIANRVGVIEWVNPAFTRLTGYTSEEAVGKPFRNLIRSDSNAQGFFEECWETILAGRTWRGEIDNRRKDGSLYTEEQVVTPILDASGAITHFIAIKEDITKRLQLEAQFRQAQKMESVGQLASGIAHDFNNLLTVINGMSELVLTQVGADDPIHADVQEIGRAGERAATLTRQLLAFSRQQMLEVRVMSLNTVVAGMESLLQRLLGEDIDLVVVPTPSLNRVKADPGQLEQVITNLAVNARDAMPQGGQLTIETLNLTLDEDYALQHGVAVPPGSYVLLVVTDSGVGMDEATRASIFEPFFTTKAPGKGTGLGLSTAYGIVKQSNGFIRVYSEVGKGTSFKIFLPQVTEAADADRPVPAVVSTSGTETILVVEDNDGLRKLATRVLEPAGYTVLGAATGDEALRLLERHEAPVHLLLSDVVMPGMSGRHLAEQLAQTRPGMKVLYMSGYTSDTIVRHGVLEAQMPFLNKPFTATALLRKVREVLDSEASSTHETQATDSGGDRGVPR
jgi:two-component system cell cycle sensor histidine kinase/response regulator CckA